MQQLNKASRLGRRGDVSGRVGYWARAKGKGEGEACGPAAAEALGVMTRAFPGCDPETALPPEPGACAAISWSPWARPTACGPPAWRRGPTRRDEHWRLPC